MKIRVTAILVVLLFFSIGYAVLPLLRPGYIPTHDGEFHIIRIWQFYKQLSAGVLIPRWAPDLNSGYGVPLFNFYYPFPNYVGSFFHSLHFSYPDSLKLSLALSYALAVIFCFLWLKKLFGTKGALFGSVIFSFVPYWFVDIYVRGALGEVMAIPFLMMALWSFESKLGMVATIASAGIIVSHNLSALIFFPFLTIYALVRQRHRTFWWMLLGVGLASYFWIPAIAEQRFVMGLNNFDYRDHFPMLAQLLVPSWGTGFSGPSYAADEMSMQLGVAVLLLFPFVFWNLHKERNEKYKRLVWIYIIVFGFIIFLMLRVSQPIWDFLHPMQFLQFPWRFLSLVLPISALFSGYIGWKTKRNYILVLFALLSIGLSWSYVRPVVYQSRSDDYYLNRKEFSDGTANVGNNFSTLWSAWKKERAKNKIEVLEGTVQISNLHMQLNSYRFVTSSISKGILRINTAYYPGWIVELDSERVTIDYEKEGVITFPVSPGEHSVRVYFTETPLRLLANSISIGCLFWIVGSAILNKYAHRYRYFSNAGRA